VSPDRTYGQWCALALALDRIGDRWTLLILRELMIGPRRFTDLSANLPGISPSLLSGRLALLERDGLLCQSLVPPPTPATLYELTDVGADLRPAILAVIRWGGRWMPEAAGDFRPEWLALALEAILGPRAASLEDVRIGIVLPGGAALQLQVAHGEIASRVGTLEDCDVTITGAPEALLARAVGHNQEGENTLPVKIIDGSPAGMGAVGRLFP
jgi:DNA-binding HxlR family transcriptional regulator